MGRRFTYDCVLTHEDDGWLVSFPQIPAAHSDGDTRDEALKNAAEVLALALADYVEEDREAPRYERSAEVVAVSVDITDEMLDEMKYMTQAQAAEQLDVSPARVSALIKSGTLDAKWFGGVREVSIESVNRYEASPRRPGRPAARERELATA